MTKLALYAVVICQSLLMSFASDVDAQQKYLREIEIELPTYENADLKVLINDIQDRSDFEFASPRRLITKKSISLEEKRWNMEHLLREISSQAEVSIRRVNETISFSEVEMQALPDVVEVNIVQVSISGTITDEDGEALPGATIQEKGTTNGTITDVDGSFSLVAAENATLTISFVGFSTKEIPLNGQTVVNVQLLADISSLEEVVVVGYGTQQKSDLTGSVSTVDAEVIAQRQSFQVSDALQGALAGVSVTRNNSEPGATSTIRVRGVTTFNTNDPLVIIDGIASDGINDINPADIESITILKDAASASIYGSRAAAGVILVTTKRGAKSQQGRLTYSFDYGFNSPTKLPEYVDAVRYMELWNEHTPGFYADDFINNYRANNVTDHDQYPLTDWWDVVMTESSTRQRHDLSYTNGNEFIQSRASFSYATEDAFYANRDYERITARVNNNVTLNKSLTGIFDIAYKLTNIQRPNFGSVVADSRGFPGIYDNIRDDGLFAIGKSDGANPYASLYGQGVNQEEYNSITGRIGFEFTPINDLKLTAIISPAFDFNKQKSFQNAYDVYDYGASSPLTKSTDKLTEERVEQLILTKQFIADYNKSFGEHNINVLAGYEDRAEDYEFLIASREGFGVTSLPYLALGSEELRDNNGWAYEYGLRSYLGRLQYDFAGKYLFQFNFRADGSSRFAENNRWGYFPSASAGWVISEENFFDQNSVLSFLKVRASYGSVGNERVSGSNSDSFKWWPYQALIDFRSSLLYRGNTVVSELAGAQQTFAVENIVWETTTTMDFGTDLMFLNDKLSFAFDYYIKNTNDILMELDIPNYMGYVDPVTNVGEIQVKGWDLEASWRDKIGELNYSVAFNFSDSKSEVIDIKDREDLFHNNGTRISIEGREMMEWYGYQTQGLFQTQADVDASAVYGSQGPGDIRYVDQLTVDTNNDGIPDDVDGVINEQDKVPLGGSLPRYIYGGNISAQFKGFDFSLVLQGVAKSNNRLTGIQVMPFAEGFKNVPNLIDNKFWSPNNTEDQNLAAEYPRIQLLDFDNYQVSDFWMVSGAYMRIKNINLGYTLPDTITEKIKMSNLRFYLSLRDFFTINQYPQGWDPEVDATSYPITKTTMLGVSVSF